MLMSYRMQVAAETRAVVEQRCERGKLLQASHGERIALDRWYKIFKEMS